MLYENSAISTIMTTTTAADGAYTFIGAPSLTAGQWYYVGYTNSGLDPTRLFSWSTRTLTSYTAGSDVNIGNFDIAAISLVAPGNGATVSLPATFQWTPRPGSSSDSYEVELYDPVDFDPFWITYPYLGYVGSYTLNSLPTGFSTGAQYVWNIAVNSADGGFGSPLTSSQRYVTFSSTGFSSDEGPAGEPLRLPEAIP